jgi:beta-galactosidase beta subunit
VEPSWLSMKDTLDGKFEIQSHSKMFTKELSIVGVTPHLFNTHQQYLDVYEYS